ncbi:GNAT family N-acetyltransferase [Flavimaricola marinus]|uniref:N-acyltransferase YncA n=1 Tax=Flavimaricola marinus TaxID=1819565 RepID=A0A238LEG0_9RHOB|nr:GNAT family N-acetyltransferase [Flavimaricola marinus]SMY07346.1 N-acyltransferase YncA [Flavimaricola marinus]
MSDLIIRTTLEADLPEITEIYAAEVLHHVATFEEVPPTTAEMTERWRTILGQGYPHRVAVLDGRVLGYAYASVYRTRPAYRHTVEGSIYLAPDARGRGVGKALLADLLRECEAGPWQQMVAVIGDSANAASIGLHKSQGFRMVGTLEAVGFKHGRWVDTVLMQRALTPAAQE